MTPEYIWHRMTLEDVREAVGYVVRELPAATKEQAKQMVKSLNDWLTPGAAQDLSWIKGPIGKVIKKHG